MKKWIFSAAWGLLALLGISAMILTAGRNMGETRPAANSYAPSGVSALAELLRLRGYEIEITSRPSPELRPGDVVAAFQLSGRTVDPDSSVSDATENVRTTSKKGNLVFWLPVPNDFEDSSAMADKPIDYKRVDGQVRKLSGSSESVDDEESQSNVTLAMSDNVPFVTANRLGKGTEVTYADAIGLTNRYIDKADNAKFFLETLKTYAPNAKRVVFTQATFGVSQAPGLLETIGLWAEGSWYQIIFIFVIVIVSLNQRFGIPRRLRPVQTGGRELVDALTDTMIRARATGMSLTSAGNSADRRLRNLLKLPRDASDGERDRVLPPDVARRLADVRAASGMSKVQPTEALRLVIALDKSLDELTLLKRGNLSSKKRRKNVL